MKRFFLALLMMGIGIVVTAGCYQFKSDIDMTRSPESAWHVLCGLTREQFAEMNETQVRQWLESQYRKEWIQYSSDSAEKRAWFKGTLNNESIEISLLGDHIDYIHINSPKINPTFGQVVSSFGNPEMIYHHRYLPIVYEGTAGYTIGLDYPTFGISVYYSDWCGVQKNCLFNTQKRDGKLAFQIQKNIPVNMVDCYQSDSSMMEVAESYSDFNLWISKSVFKYRLTWVGFDEWIYFPD